jgi:hypothetical protein
MWEPLYVGAALCGSRFSGEWVLATGWPAAAGSPLKRLPQNPPQNLPTGILRRNLAS